MTDKPIQAEVVGSGMDEVERVLAEPQSGPEEFFRLLFLGKKDWEAYRLAFPAEAAGLEMGALKRAITKLHGSAEFQTILKSVRDVVQVRVSESALRVVKLLEWNVIVPHERVILAAEDKIQAMPRDELEQYALTLTAREQKAQQTASGDKGLRSVDIERAAATLTKLNEAASDPQKRNEVRMMVNIVGGDQRERSELTVPLDKRQWAGVEDRGDLLPLHKPSYNRGLAAARDDMEKVRCPYQKRLPNGNENECFMATQTGEDDD